MADPSIPSVYLYPGAVAFVVFIIIYTFGSAVSAGFAHILFRLNGKQVVYVSLMSVSIFVQNILTLLQESYSFAEWPTLQIKTYERNLEQWRNPNASIVYQTSPSVFVQVIFSIRIYFFNVESLLFFFWSFMLFISVWEIQNHVLKSEKFVAGTKYFAFILPAFQVVFTSLEPIKSFPTLHLIFANCTMVITLSLGCVFMGLILFRCFHVMWGSSWTHKVKLFRGYDNGHGPARRLGTSLSATSTNSGSDSEDRYILLRFLAGFAIIGGLQASFMTSQLTYAQGVLSRKQPTAPKPQLGWSSNDQLIDWSFYLASGSTGYLILIVFGTTRESRRQIRRLWAGLRGRVRMRDKMGEEYISFRSETDTYERPSTPERKRGPPKAMTFVSSRITSLGSPEVKVKAFEPESYKDVDLMTPRLSAL